MSEANSGLLSRIVLGSRLKYLGLTLLLAWHYCLWFVPDSFPDLFLLDDRVTFSWLIALASTVVTLAILVLTLGGRRRRLAPTPVLIWSSALAGSAATGALTIYAIHLATPILCYCLAAIIGISGGLLWVLWGDQLAVQRVKFTLPRIAPVYASFLLAALALAFLIPGGLAPVFVACLPLASAVLLQGAARLDPAARPPVLLPRSTAKGAISATVTVCLIAFVASFISYFVVAIVPWEALWSIEHSFTIGIVIGACFLLLATALGAVKPGHYTVFRLFPWLLFADAGACALCLAGFVTQAAAFFVALAVSSVFEVLLTMYMGVLTLRGYLSPLVAFALSVGSIRLGIALGNGTALIYERLPGWAETWTTPSLLIMLAILTGLIIPLVRQEYTITELTRSLDSVSELELVISQVVAEFGLSERERDILDDLGRGFSASAIAQHLFISPHTVNTHIRHIYDKMGIHKRSELLSYLNRRD